MLKYPKGSNPYRKLLAIKSQGIPPFNPTKWIEKLHDGTITTKQVKNAFKKCHSNYLTPTQREFLIKFFNNKHLFGAQLVAAKLIDEGDGYCRTCQREGDGDEVTEYLRHTLLECPLVRDLRVQILIEFGLHNENIPTTPGSLILDILTPADSSADLKSKVEFLNTIWSITLSKLLEINSKRQIPMIDLMIVHIKSCLKRILRLRPNSVVALVIKHNSLEKLLSSGFSPHDPEEYF